MSISNSSKPRGARRGRRILAACVAVIWLGLLAWAHFDVEDRVASARSEAAASLGGLARTANLLFAAEDRAIAGELEALRSELRAAQALEHPARLRALADQGEEATTAENRQLEGLARRALSSSDRLGALDLVVADQQGLWVRGFVRDGQAVRERSAASAELREGMAKALWYSEEVRRAVASSGRSVERGEIAFEGEIARPWLRLAIGLHDAHALVQGALVASADLTPLAGALASLAGNAAKVTLVGIDGRPLDPSIAARADASRWVDLTARILDADAPLEPFEADGRLVLGMPLADRSGHVTDLVLLLETPAPAPGLAGWLATAWPIALAGVSFLSCLAMGVLLRGPGIAAAVDVSPGCEKEPDAGVVSQLENPPVEPSAAVASPDGVAPEVFSLREWLSDVRGCLEREAATRGLGFGLRCERSLPNEAHADPAWLGGLLVAMGREALDAAAEDKVRFEVCEEAGETLRFELDAGGVALYPSGGMNAAAARLGARLESSSAGRLALVVPAMLA